MDPNKPSGHVSPKRDTSQSALSRLVGEKQVQRGPSNSDAPVRRLPPKPSVLGSAKNSPAQSPDGSPFSLRRDTPKLPEPQATQSYALMSGSVRKQRGDERESVEGVRVLYDPASGGNTIVYDPLLNKPPGSGENSPDRGSPAAVTRKPAATLPPPLVRSATAPVIAPKIPVLPKIAPPAPDPTSSPFGDPQAPAPALLSNGLVPPAGTRARGSSIYDQPAETVLRPEADSTKASPRAALGADEATAPPLPVIGNRTILTQSAPAVPPLKDFPPLERRHTSAVITPSDPLLNPEKSPRSPRPGLARLPSSSIPPPVLGKMSIPLPAALPPPPEHTSPQRSPRPRAGLPPAPSGPIATGKARPPSQTIGASPPPPLNAAIAKSRPPSVSLVAAASVPLPPPPAGTLATMKAAVPPGVVPKKPAGLPPATETPAVPGSSTPSVVKTSSGSKPASVASVPPLSASAIAAAAAAANAVAGAAESSGGASRPASVVLPPLPPAVPTGPTSVAPSPRLSEDYLIAGALRPERKGPLFEHFLVVGLPLNAKLPRVPAKYEPQILFKWPPDVKLRVGQIEQFCFPTGVEVSTVRRTPSMSSLHEIMFASSNITHASNSFSFLLTGEGTFLYGVCVVRDELLGEAATFFDGPNNPLPFQRSYIVAPKCYCFLTRFPYFRLHFDVLHNILAHERMLKMQRDMFDTPPENLRKSMSNFNDVVPLMRAPAATNTQPLWEGVAPDQTQSLEEARDPSSMFSSIERILALSPRPGRTLTASSSNSNSSANASSGDREDQSQHPVRRILAAYYATPMPTPGGTLIMQLPPGVQELQPFNPFTCPLEDETAALLGEWAVTALCRSMSVENILLMLSAVLQEKQVIIVSRSLGTLSYVSLAVIPMLRPFVWQGLFIPILPQLLIDYVEAPVPYIAGLLRGPDNLREDLVVVQIDANKVSSGAAIERLPEFTKLSNNLRNDHKVLYKPNVQLNPYHTTPAEQAAATAVVKAFNGYLTWLSSKMVEHYKKWNMEVADQDEVKQSFLKAVSANNRKFMETLMNTQHFQVYIDQMLRKEKELLLSQRLGK